MKARVHPTAIIEDGAELASGVTVGPYAVIGARVRIGEACEIRAHAVVEGVGDHGCEYMTGGRAVILGPTGRNFAAGMSGGIAWVYDPRARLAALCNPGMVDLERVVEPHYEEELRDLVTKHYRLTGSDRAQTLLERWEEALPQFVQVMPRDYKRALAGLEFAETGNG